MVEVWSVEGSDDKIAVLRGFEEKLLHFRTVWIFDRVSKNVDHLDLNRLLRGPSLWVI